MASDALKRLNERLGGQNTSKAGSVGQKTSGDKADEKQTVTAINSAEAFGVKTEKPTQKEDGEKPKRGWPKGKKRGSRTGRTGTAAKENKVLVEGVASTLYGIHFFAAKALDAQEFELSEDEAEKMAHAIQRVSDQYGKVIDPKTEAIMGLAGIMGACYVPRIMAFNARRAMEKKRENPNNSNGQPTRPQPQPQPAQKPQAKPATRKDTAPENPSEFFGPLNLGDGPIQ